MKEFLDKVKFDSNGLVLAVVQDVHTNEVLMCAYMNRESLEYTLKEKKCCYYSRSRKKLWLKGETSGHFQVVKEVRFDCDVDALLFFVEQEGGACHDGYESCFYRALEGEQIKIVGKKCFDPGKVYSNTKNK
jgi:phosphoribosyl-AMP cyclohydrolase